MWPDPKQEERRMTDPSWYSILPPILAIILAIWSKQVILSLFAGIWMGYTILNGFNPLLGVTAGLDGVITVFTDTRCGRSHSRSPRP